VILDAANTAIVLDSTADFPEGPERFPNWRIVPLYVRFGTESLRDYVELDPDEFYRRLRTASELPTTSQPTPADFLRVYQDLEGRYERVLSLHLGGTFSGTVESARRAAAEIEGGRVRVLDTGTASAAIAILALAVQRRLERGTSDEDVDALLERFRRDARLLFTVDTLEFLQRGGRIGRARALAGQLLNVKPILAIRDGEVVPVKRVRSNQKAFLEFAREFEEGTEDTPRLHVGVAHADAPDRLDALVRMVQRTRPQAQLDVATTLGPVIGTHAGPGTAGLFWFDDPEA
jgi:fatty acid kinase fatty acid binding subunit